MVEERVFSWAIVETLIGLTTEQRTHPIYNFFIHVHLHYIHIEEENY